MRSALTCVILLLAAAVALGQQPPGITGSICGLVSDENGAPASHVHVVALPHCMGPGACSMGVLGSDTDEAGHYCIERLRIGEYVMSAADEKKGYPLRSRQFYRWDSPDPAVTLTSYNPDAHLDWRIPFKAGLLKLHVSVDHADVDTVPITFDLAVGSQPKVRYTSVMTSLRTDPRDSFTVLLPPGEDVSLTAMSPGYRHWPEDERGMLLNLRPGETKDFTISLTTVTP